MIIAGHAVARLSSRFAITRPKFWQRTRTYSYLIFKDLADNHIKWNKPRAGTRVSHLFRGFVEKLLVFKVLHG